MACVNAKHHDNAPQKLTPADVARRYGVTAEKVLHWIRRGELRAMNVAASINGTPRYRVDVRDLVAFERLRETHSQGASTDGE